MDEAFERALQRIPAQLRERPGARFTVILNGTKKPEGTDWSGPNGANYGIKDAPLAGYLAEGHNYGVLCGHAGIAVPDLDDLDRLGELGVMDRIPETWQVKTGRDGRHVYFDCPELDHQIGLYDPELKDEDGEPLHLGEIQSLGQQVVGPGSIHPNGNRYEIINDAPILPISKADLLKIFDGLILTGIDDPAEEPHRAESRRRKAGGASVGDYIPIDQVCWPKDVKEHHGPEVIGSHPVHGSKTGKNFSVNTAKNCWHCFRCGPPKSHRGGGGPLEWLAVEAGLISCKDAKPGCLNDNGLFKKVLQIARDRGFSIPEPEKRQKAEEPKPKGPTVLDALKAMLEHDSEVRTDKESSTWEWRVHKPRMEQAVKAGWMTAQAEEKAHKFLGKYKKNLEAWGIAYDNLFPLPKKENKEEFSDKIRAKALNVLKTGDPVQYVADSCGRTVLGAEKAFKKVACCVSVQNVRQSAGLHPKFTGESSGGKTYTIYTFANHLPYEAVIKGSMSAKAGFYHSDGNRVFRILDDYQPGNEDLDTVIKQTTSEFHDTYAHRTVANHAAQTLKIGSEQTWAITSVNNDQDIQVLNRGMPINVDDSDDMTEKVNKRTVERYGTGEAAKLVDEQVLVSRCIFQILRDEGYINVRIPFYERIKWHDKTNRRNPSIFMDLVIAHTALNRFQREKDSEGYYLATEEDFQAAKALFTDKDGEELVKRLTKREREVLEELVKNPDGVTRSDLSEALKIAPQQVSQILGGQKGQGGLMQKVAIKEERRSEMEKINEEQSRTIHRTLYSLKEYNKFEGFDAVVTLEPKPQQEASRNSRKEDESKDESKSTDGGKEDESKESKRKREREEREKREHSSPFVDEESTLSREEKKDTFVTFAMEHDSEKDTFAITSSTLSSEEDESKLVVRFRTEYRTDWKGAMHVFQEGDETEVSRERAELWQKRGTVDILEGEA